MKKSIYSKEYKIFIQQLIDLRLSKSIKQCDLAQKLNVHQSFVSKYETGERRLDIIELNEICMQFNISLLDFVIELDKELRESK